MIYLKNKQGGNIEVFKDVDLKSANNRLDSGQWVRINGRKDESEYVASKPKKASKSATGDGSFVDSLKETGTLSGEGAAPEITGVAGVEGILAAQNTAEPVADQRRRQRLMAYGDDLLERLDDLRIGILLGRFSKEKLTELAQLDHRKPRHSITSFVILGLVLLFALGTVAAAVTKHAATDRGADRG